MNTTEWIEVMIDNLETIRQHVETGEYKEAQELVRRIAGDAEYLHDLIENNKI